MSPQEPDEGDRVTVDPTLADEEVLPARKQEQDHPRERERQERGNRGPDEEPGFGQGG